MMMTGGVNPYTTRSMTKLYRIECYNGLNPKRLQDQVSLGRCRPSGCLSFQVLRGGDVFFPGRCPLLPVPVPGLFIGGEAPGVRGRSWQVSSWDQSYWSSSWQLPPRSPLGVFASFGELIISAAWDAGKIGGCSSAYLDLPSCSWVNYSNFPICSWRGLIINTIISHFVRGFAYYLLKSKK